jgi:hypothetical protein
MPVRSGPVGFNQLMLRPLIKNILFFFFFLKWKSFWPRYIRENKKGSYARVIMSCEWVGPLHFVAGARVGCRNPSELGVHHGKRTKIKNNEASSWYSSIYNSLYYSLCTTCILNSQVVLNIVLRVILLGFPPGATILYIRAGIYVIHDQVVDRSFDLTFLFFVLVSAIPPPFFSKRNDYTPKSKDELNESHANAYGKEFEEATDKIMMKTSEPANCW